MTIDNVTTSAVARDLFGDPVEPGDVIVYCPGSKRNAELRVGVFVGRTLDPRGHSAVKIKFMTDYGNGWDSKFAIIKAEIFAKRSALVNDVAFRLNNILIQNAVKYIDYAELKGPISDSQDQNQESV